MSLHQFLVKTPASSRTLAVTWEKDELPSYDDLLLCIVHQQSRSVSKVRDPIEWDIAPERVSRAKQDALTQNAYLVGDNGRVVDRESFSSWLLPSPSPSGSSSPTKDITLHSINLKYRIRGGMDRQNRAGSKFGGGGVSSSQNAERERKERLKRLALESIDLAKDPYLVRNHLGSYECKLCLTLHRDEANYLAHTQGKKHQQGLARRAHLEKLKQEREGTAALPMVSTTTASAASSAAGRTKVKIGRPAYQVFKSRDADTNQRCLSFELHYPELDEDWQPRHRFMSAFEQRVESPPDRRYQYLLFAAGDYETVAFRIPNEPIDKNQDRFVTHWDADGKKFTLTLYFMEPAGE